MGTVLRTFAHLRAAATDQLQLRYSQLIPERTHRYQGPRSVMATSLGGRARRLHGAAAEVRPLGARGLLEKERLGKIIALGVADPRCCLQVGELLEGFYAIGPQRHSPSLHQPPAPRTP